jgi:hypothetical protein
MVEVSSYFGHGIYDPFRHFKVGRAWVPRPFGIGCPLALDETRTDSRYHFDDVPRQYVFGGDGATASRERASG